MAISRFQSRFKTRTDLMDNITPNNVNGKFVVINAATNINAKIRNNVVNNIRDL